MISIPAGKRIVVATAPVDGRKGMATARQLRMLEAMWADVSRAGTQAARTAAWKAFLCRWSIGGMAEIEYWQVSKLVTALKAMQQEAAQ